MMTRLSALLLLACAALALLAATAAADPCPVTAAFNGCFKDGCVTLPTASKKPGKVVCAKCVSQLGYELVYAGTTKARCDCAPGYAGRDNKSICTACPVGTDIAPGGPKGSSVCLRCPPDTLVVRNEEDGSADCACAPGSHRAPPSKVVKGFKAVACKPCTARNAYTEQINVARSCATCPVPQVANTRHDACGARRPAQQCLPRILRTRAALCCQRARATHALTTPVRCCRCRHSSCMQWTWTSPTPRRCCPS